jgi:hypothetical protein
MVPGMRNVTQVWRAHSNACPAANKKGLRWRKPVLLDGGKDAEGNQIDVSLPLLR